MTHPEHTEPDDDLVAALADEYHQLIDNLAAEFDLDTGAELGNAPAQYASLTRQLDAELDLDAGLDRVLSPTRPLGKTPTTASYQNSVTGNATADGDHRSQREDETDQESQTTCTVDLADLINCVADFYAVADRAERDLGFPPGLRHDLMQVWVELDTRRALLFPPTLLTELPAIARVAAVGGQPVGDRAATALFDIRQALADSPGPSLEPAKTGTAATTGVTVLLDQLRAALLVSAWTSPETDAHLRATQAVRREIVHFWRSIEDRSVDRRLAEFRARGIGVMALKAVAARREDDLAEIAEQLPRAVRRLFEPSDHDAPSPSRLL